MDAEPGDTEPLDDKLDYNKIVDDLLNSYFMKSKTGRIVAASFFLSVFAIGMYLLLLLHDTDTGNLMALEMSMEVVELMLVIATAAIGFTVMLLVGLYYNDHSLITIFFVYPSFFMLIFVVCGFVADLANATNWYINPYKILKVVFNAFSTYMIYKCSLRIKASYK